MKIINSPELDTQRLIQTSRHFFSAYGTPKLLGTAFFSETGFAGIKPEEEQDLFEMLLEKCGFQDDSAGFFLFLFSKISAGEKTPFSLNKTSIPTFYIYHLLECVYPGNRLHEIKTTEQLKNSAHVVCDDASVIQQVIDQFPVRLSDHVIRQSQVSGAVAKQYFPFAKELDDTGHTITFDGHFKNGVLEQMYQNRVIFLLDKHCPVYCRFCFRKHKSTRKEKNPSAADVQKAVEYVKFHPSIHEILITGGEPLLNRPNIETALNGLMKIDHISTVRIATRSVSYYPELFLKNDKDYVRYLVEKNITYQQYDKRIEIGIHFVHPDEISIQSLEIISLFVKNGIQVYVQTPFLKDLNDSGKILQRLFSLLRQAGAQIYYIFTPCHTIYGTKEYWTPVSQSFQAYNHLRQNVSDRCMPKLCTATALGKIEWNTSGWAVEKDEIDPEYTWIRTPYTLEYFQQFIKTPDGMPEYRINSEGTLDAKFRLDMGDAALYADSRSFRNRIDTLAEKNIPPERSEQSDLMNFLYSLLYDTPRLSPSISPVPIKEISRIHKACVEIRPEMEKIRLDYTWFDYIKSHPEITDVIIHWNNNPVIFADEINRAVEQLKTLSHIVCVRLRAGALCCSPLDFNDAVIKMVCGWSDFSCTNPFRIEMETWFLVPDQITDDHKTIVKKLLNKGVNVYANVPLINGINNDPQTMVQLAHILRRAKIEFHHLYVGGHDIQEQTGQEIKPQSVIDIASLIRTQCSGRQIPLYVIKTPKGDIDFGLDFGLIPFSPGRLFPG